MVFTWLGSASRSRGVSLHRIYSGSHWGWLDRHNFYICQQVWLFPSTTARSFSDIPCTSGVDASPDRIPWGPSWGLGALEFWRYRSLWNTFGFGITRSVRRALRCLCPDFPWKWECMLEDDSFRIMCGPPASGPTPANRRRECGSIPICWRRPKSPDPARCGPPTSLPAHGAGIPLPHPGR